MGVQQYDEIGEVFEGFKSLPLTRYGEVPSFLGLVGVEGRSVLDPACGTGFYSREFTRRGAAEVLGVDISVQVIAAARDIERRDPLDVRYQVGDVCCRPAPRGLRGVSAGSRVPRARVGRAAGVRGRHPRVRRGLLDGPPRPTVAGDAALPGLTAGAVPPRGRHGR